MRGIKPKLSISKLSIFGSWGSGAEMSAKLISRHWKESLWVTLKETTDTWCTYTIHTRLWKFEMWSSRSPKLAQSLTTQRRPETTLRQDASDVEEAALDEERLGVSGRHWNGVLLTDRWLLWRGTGASGQGRAQTRDTSKKCSAIFWRSRDTSCCDWRWLCGTQNSLRKQARWRLVPVALGKEGRGQGTPRQRDLEPCETTHRKGRHTGRMGLQSEIGTQWSSGQIKSRLCGEGLQIGGRTGLLGDFCAYL